MRFELDIVLEKPELPIEYRKAILSLNKKALSEINDGKYLPQYYEGCKTKDFCFAVRMSKPHFTKESIYLESNTIHITYSTSDKLTGYILFSAMVNQKNKRFPLQNSNAMRVTGIHQINEKRIMQNDVMFKLLAPLVVREHNKENNKDRYYSVEDREFTQKVIDSLRYQLVNAGYREEQVKSIEFIPINMKKTVVCHYGCYINCTLGVFALKGNKSILNYLYQDGVAGRKSAGYGILDILAE